MKESADSVKKIDPSNLTPQQRKQRPLFNGLVKYFPAALRAVSNVSFVGNEQHHPGQPLHWDKSKSADEADALLRHLTEYAEGKIFDADGSHVLSKVAWRSLALLQREIDREKEAGTYNPPKFGTRTVLKFLDMRKWGNKIVPYWWVRCDCGHEFKCSDYSIFQLRCIKCNNKGPRPNRRKRPFEAQYNALVGKSKHPVLLSYDEFVSLTKIKECHYCGETVIWSEYGRATSATNLDRKDSRLSYSLDNVVVCCKRCNYGKNRFFTYDEWKQLGSLIRKWREKQK